MKPERKSDESAKDDKRDVYVWRPVRSRANTL